MLEKQILAVIREIPAKMSKEHGMIVRIEDIRNALEPSGNVDWGIVNAELRRLADAGELSLACVDGIIVGVMAQ